MKSIYEIIATKRDGRELDASEIQFVVKQYTAGKIPDYQMSSLLMASFINGLSTTETSALTKAMLASGTTVQVEGLDRPLIDKHSTGGVGDKLSLTLSPLLAQCGIAVGMFSGRGLGHTGGTLDKLESIPGMQVFHSTTNFGKLLKKHHWAVTGQTAQIAPADKKIYALRDASGTVESIPLIVASIMSKKLALKSDGIVFDVKCGSGAFMKSSRDAQNLAKSLLAVSLSNRLPARALITNMNQPTGRMIGNFLEIVETVEVLKGGGSSDTIELTLELGASMLSVAGVETNKSAGIRQMKSALTSGSAYESWCRYISSCGGDIKVFERPERMMKTAHKAIVKSPRSGYIIAIDTGRLGFLAVRMGAGRQAVADKIDYLAGIELLCKIGSKVTAGEPMAIGYSRQSSQLTEFTSGFLDCITIGDDDPGKERLILKRL
ncbi:MAG: thymidine phosphorylase [bacterium]|nr:thymidine phosphorylase [bacterium]